MLAATVPSVAPAVAVEAFAAARPPTPRRRRPVHVTKAIQAPPPTPAVNPSQAAAVAKLKELESLQSQGLVGETQYQAEAQELFN